MSYRQPLTLLAVATAVLAKPSPLIASRQDNTTHNGIQWGECDFNASVPIECGRLGVPLDYTDPGAGTLDLSLSKVAAVNEPFKGSILFNFGGPGFEAIKTLGSLAPQLLNMTGGQHDLITFDPRGTGQTIPFDCFETPEERELVGWKYRLDQLLSDSSDVALGESWANAGAFTSICAEAGKDIGELVGTAFVARDLMEVVDALDEDGLLRFWGLSYGSALGATTAAMFPDRMDRVVLDAVVNSDMYNHGYTIDGDQMNGAEDAWTALLEECIVSGEKCGLSKVNETAADLKETLSRVAEELRTKPIAVGDTVVTYSTITAAYYAIVKTPNDLTAATEMLNNLINRENLTAVAEYFTGQYEGVQMGNEALWAIKCGDTTARSSDLEGIMGAVEYALESSPSFGAIQPVSGALCAQWPFKPKERYTGDFHTRTPNPVLFVGNTYDAATAIGSAYKMSERFEGSIVLEQKGFGHGSIAQASACTSKIIRDYFVDGVTPEANVECEVDVPLFV